MTKLNALIIKLYLSLKQDQFVDEFTHYAALGQGYFEADTSSLPSSRKMNFQFGNESKSSPLPPVKCHRCGGSVEMCRPRVYVLGEKSRLKQLDIQSRSNIYDLIQRKVSEEPKPAKQVTNQKGQLDRLNSSKFKSSLIRSWPAFPQR